MSEELITTAGLLLFGLLLVAIEVFVLPGIGMVGIAGGVCLLLASGLVFAWFGVGPGMGALLVSLLGPILLLAFFLKSSAGKRLVLGAALTQEDAAQARALKVGDEGQALSPLRPAGTALFGAERVDVVTDGQYVDSGAPLRVVEITSSRVLVERADNADNAAGAPKISEVQTTATREP